MLNQKQNIVVVDDEKDITELYREVLETHYNVMEFNHPEEFLKYLQFHEQAPFHAVVTDFKMPKMNGLQMIQKSFDLGYKFPFIMLSGHLDKATVIQAVTYGAFRLLEKPTSSETLFEAIDQIVIEHEIHLNREQIRNIVGMLRENYTYMRTTLTRFLSEEDQQKLVVQTDAQGHIVKSESFDELMNRLEDRLDELLSTEATLESLKTKLSKKAA